MVVRLHFSIENIENSLSVNLSDGNQITKKRRLRENMSLVNPYKFETEQWKKNLLVCGIDEVGRGCLAGPIVTAAAILHPYTKNKLLIDSKQLSSTNLIKIYKWLINHCTYSIAINSNQIIDQHNIYQATAMTMKQALLHLLVSSENNPAIILVDAMPLKIDQTAYQHIPILSFTQGESKSASIAAASIIAKVTRDRILQRLDATFPSYKLAQHKGYATKLHCKNLKTYHPSIIHRTTFLKKILSEKNYEQQSIFC